MAGPVLGARHTMSDFLDAQNSQRQTRIWRVMTHVTRQEMRGALGGSPREGKGYKYGPVRAGLMGVTSEPEEDTGCPSGGPA